MVRQLSPSSIVLAATLISASQAYAPTPMQMTHKASSSRRGFVSQSVAFALGTATASSLASNANVGGVANAVGPVKINIVDPVYFAAPCPPDKPIPGEKAMKGMRGLCVQVKAKLEENSPKVSC